MTKICTKCGLEKGLTEYHKKGKGRQPSCKCCVNAYQAKYRADNPTKIKDNNTRYYVENNKHIKARSRSHYVENREQKKAFCAEYYAEHSVHIKASKAKYRIENPEKVRVAKAQYHAAHPEIAKANAARRRAAKLQATIPGHNEALREIYKNCPPGHHVDHIVPLQGKSVSGLHVPWNLQYLPADENLRKGNSFNG